MIVRGWHRGAARAPAPLPVKCRMRQPCGSSAWRSLWSPVQPGRAAEAACVAVSPSSTSQVEATKAPPAGFDTARPAGVIRPTASPSGAIRISGRFAVSHNPNPPTTRAADSAEPIISTPLGPERRQHRISPTAPKPSIGRTGPGAIGIAVTAPSSPATKPATASIQTVPRPMTHSATPSSPRGASSSAITPDGITSVPITGTASMFASKPYCDMRLKCAAPIGAVARPATSDETSSIATGRSQRGRRLAWRLQGSKVRISAMVAAKLIWKPGEVSASGLMTRIAVAASATVRREIALRSARTANSITATVTKARCVATLAPDSHRYPAAATSAPSAAILCAGKGSRPPKPCASTSASRSAP